MGVEIKLLWLVGNDDEFLRMAQSAADRAFPSATTSRLKSVGDAMHSAASPGTELMLLQDPSKVEWARAKEALDGLGLPRWPVIVFGNAPSDEMADAIPREEWDIPGVARSLRAACARHALERENIRYRGDFRTLAHRISHDLRTHLGGILVNAELLKEELSEAAPEQVELTQYVITAANGMEALVGRFSQFAKAISIPARTERFNMAVPFKMAWDHFELEILERGAQLSQPERWPEINGVLSWTEMVWQNLLSNTFDHGKSPPRIEVGWTRAERELLFWIKDGGRVAEEDRDLLFQPFHQLFRSHGVRGLGLPIVQRLMELQGGCCGYAPLFDREFCFYFSLPEKSDEARSPERSTDSG